MTNFYHKDGKKGEFIFRKSRFAVKSPNMNKIRWGVIGAGDIVKKRVAPAINELSNSEFVAVTRANADTAEAFAKEFGARKWYADWREVIVDPEIDAVYIATPVHLHAEQTMAAADAGKHVLCEKPMALNVAECDRMIAACEANDVKLGIAYYRRFYPVLERVRQVLAADAIGKPSIAQINAFEYVPLTADEDRGWFVDPAKSGGGPMMDFGCHRIEVLTDLFGEVRSQKSITTKNVFSERDVEDSAALLMEFAEGPLASVTVTHAAIEPRDTLVIYGTKGSIEIPSLNAGNIIIRTHDGETIGSHPPHANFHLPLIENFADAILNDREPRVGGGTGRLVAAIEDRVYDR